MNQVQADGGVTRVPVGVDGTRLEGKDCYFWEDSATDIAAFLRGASRLVVFFSCEIPVMRAVEQFMQGQTCCIPVGFLAGDNAVKIEYDEGVQLIFTFSVYCARCAQ